MQTILIFGKGQLGEAYYNYFKAKPELRSVKIAERVDIRDAEAVRRAVLESNPDIVINLAAKTNIDWCEQNKQECFAANTLGADNIGQTCQEFGIYLTHLSSGCVQESKSADEVHTEADPPNPLCFYSWTKVWAENLLKDRLERRASGSFFPNPLKVLILRPRQLLSAMVSPRNALAKMLTYDKFIDTANSCTVVEDLLWVTENLIQKGATGLYNVVNSGVITPYQIAVMLKEVVKPDMEFKKISKDELNKITLAKRIDSVLSCEKLKREGIALPDIHSRLREIVLELKRNLESAGAKEVMNLVQEETRHKLNMMS